MIRRAAVIFLLLIIFFGLLIPLKPGPGPVILVGGGDIPVELEDYFIRRSGGRKAKILVIPTASSIPFIRQNALNGWKHHQVAWVRLLDPESRQQANDEAFCEVVSEATGIWFSGGDQKRLSEIITDTRLGRMVVLFHENGGIVGGTSAGASFMSRVMVPNEDKGLGILEDFIVDQHFRNRNRLPRLVAVIKKNPKLIGLGIDESTAVIIKKKRFSVLGEGGVTVVDSNTAFRPSGSLFFISY